MVKGQNENQKNKFFYIWMLTGALVLVCICAVCLNIGSVSKDKSNKGLKDPLMENLADKDAKTPIKEPVVTDEVKVADAGISDVQKTDEVNLLENDIVDDPAKAVENQQAEKPKKVEPSKEPETVSVMSKKNNVLSGLKFDEKKGLAWPASGNVIMKYSDDQGIYFATLGQYKVNPAIIISAKEGSKVVSAAKGVITSISKNEETGTTIEMAIGNDYTLTYGQLKDVCVKKGDTVSEGQQIGKIAKPSKYYVVEGSNLYFKVTQDDKTVNPMYLLK